jgi:hypothetical protein
VEWMEEEEVELVEEEEVYIGKEGLFAMSSDG